MPHRRRRTCCSPSTAAISSWGCHRANRGAPVPPRKACWTPPPCRRKTPSADASFIVRRITARTRGVLGWPGRNPGKRSGVSEKTQNLGIFRQKTRKHAQPLLLRQRNHQHVRTRSQNQTAGVGQDNTFNNVRFCNALQKNSSGRPLGNRLISKHQPRPGLHKQQPW